MNGTDLESLMQEVVCVHLVQLFLCANYAYYDKLIQSIDLTYIVSGHPNGLSILYPLISLAGMSLGGIPV